MVQMHLHHPSEALQQIPQYLPAISRRLRRTHIRFKTREAIVERRVLLQVDVHDVRIAAQPRDGREEVLFFDVVVRLEDLDESLIEEEKVGCYGDTGFDREALVVGGVEGAQDHVVRQGHVLGHWYARVVAGDLRMGGETDGGEEIEGRGGDGGRHLV